MKTEEKAMKFSHHNSFTIDSTFTDLNKELRAGWKVKPATWHNLADRISIVTLYREVAEGQNPYPDET